MCVKYNYRLMGLVLLLFMVIATGAYAGGGIEWTNINDGLPNDVQISTLAVDPGDANTIYAAGAGGVYKTTDGGSNWTDITGGLAVLSNQDSVGKEQGVANIALAVDSNNIYLGCSGRIFKGAKDGSSWSDITGTMTISSWAVLSIVVQSGSIYVGNDSGVYKSTDGGGSWVKMNKLPMPIGTISCVIVPGTTTGNLYSLTYQGAFVTTDGGQNWGSISSSYFYDLLVYPDAMYATTWNGILKSTDNGATWGTKTPVTAQGYPHITCIAGHPGNSSILYTWLETYQQSNGGMLGNLYTTTNGGNNWATVTTLSPSACAQDTLVTAGAVYVAGKEIYKSTNNGTNWSLINNGLPHHVQVNTIAADPKATGTVYIANDRGIFKSTDAGNSWQEKNIGLAVTYAPFSGFSCLTIDPNNSNVIYAGKNGSFYKSTDAGDNWGSITAGIIQQSQWGYANISSIVIDPTNSQIIYVSGDWERIYTSTDGGTTWSKITIPQTSFAKLLIAPEDSSLLYGVPNYGSNIYRSNNSGSSWTTMPIGSSWNISGIALGTTSNTIYISGSLGYYQYTLGRLLKTTDSGGTWTQISDEKVNPLIVNPDITGILYGIGNNGVVKSIDDGKSWGETNQGLPMINTGKLISANRGSVGSIAFIIDPTKHERLYLSYPPYGIYRGTDTNTAPLPPSIQTPANGAKTSDQTPLIMGNSSPGSMVLVYEGSTLRGTATPDSSGLFSLVSATLTTGAHSLTAIAVDRFGTSNTTSLSLTIVPGVAPTIDSPASGVATNSTTITVSGMAEDGSMVVIYDSLTPLTTVTTIMGLYSGTITLKDGLHHLFVMSTNQGGIIADSNIVVVLVDTIAPPAPWIQSPQPKWGLLSQTGRWGILPSNNNKPQIIGISSIPFGSITVYDNGTMLGTTTADNTGSFFLQVTQPLADGSHNLTATVKDTVNISPVSYPIQILIDTKPVITQPLAGKTNNGTFTVSGTAPPGTAVGIWIDNAVKATVTAGSSGTFTYEITTPLSNATHTIQAKNITGNSNTIKIMVNAQLPIDPINVTVKQEWRSEGHLDENNNVQGIRNRNMDIAVPVKGNPSEVKITIGTQTITLTDSDGDGVFTGSFTPTKSIDIEIMIKDASGSSTTMPLMKVVLIDPAGKVYNAINNNRIVGGTVTCYWWDNSTWVVWPAATYENQINPQITPFNNDYDYSFLTPKGKYKIKVTAQGYYPYESHELEVIDIPVFHDVYMEPIPVLTSMNVCPQAVVFFSGGTYSFTATNCLDQFGRSMSDALCNWSCGTGSFSLQTNSSVTMFTAPVGTGTYIITAATGSVSATASVIIRQPVNVSLCSSNTYVRKGDVVTIDVVVENVVDLAAAKVVLSFDKSILNAWTVGVGDFFRQGDGTVSVQSNIRNDLGTIEISGARFINSGSFGVTGSGTIYSVSFIAIANLPKGTISIAEMVLKDANLAIICPKTMIPLNIRYRLLGDFGGGTQNMPDGIIDFSDLMLFTSYWNNQDTRGDIASTKSTGTVPYFTIELDGKVDFEDLTIFAAMWYWYHTAGTMTMPAPSLAIDTPAAIVMLESTLKQDEVLVDIVVENVTNMLSGHFVVGYDADRLEVGSVNATFYRNNQHGVLDINVAGLGNLLQTGTIAQIVFKKRVPDNGMPMIIYLKTADLRLYQNGVIVPVFSPQIKQLPIPTDLDEAYCYPNPVVGGSGVTFSMLTPKARLRIYTIAGELVYDSGMKDTSSSNMTLPLGIKNDSGESVASGIYLYLITNPDGQTKTGKIGVVR